MKEGGLRKRIRLRRLRRRVKRGSYHVPAIKVADAMLSRMPSGR